MSILVADLRVFENIYTKALDFTFRRTCDINYCYTLSSLETDENVRQWVKDILTLNEWGYNVRYEDDAPIQLPNFLKFRSLGKTISTVQLLKYLECVEYNIEIDTIKTSKLKDGQPERVIDSRLIDAHKLLSSAIEELKGTIIRELVPEYETANWSE